LPADAWTTIPWREGSVDQLTSRFARLRVRAAHRDYHLGEPRPEEWLLVEWPPKEKEPTKYWLSTLPENIAFERLVELAKLRWRIERDYQELKQELGLGHYEGRGWRGLDHHAALSTAAYAFLVVERAAIHPQEGARQLNARRLASPPVVDPAAPPIRPERHVPNSIGPSDDSSRQPWPAALSDAPAAKDDTPANKPDW